MTGAGIEGAMWHDVDVSGWHPDRVWAVDHHFNPDFITEWHCQPPPFGARFTVTREEWHEVVTGKRAAPFTVVLEMPDGKEVTIDPGPEKTPVRRIYAWQPGPET